MTTNLAKTNLIATLEREDTSQEIIDYLDKILPSNFSGTETTYLKKK